jgi:hypothetical protein
MIQLLTLVVVADINIRCDHSLRSAFQGRQTMILQEPDEKGLCGRAGQHAKPCRQ